MSIDAAVEPRFGLGAIDQISFAVADVDEAVPRYTAMFGGPFAVFDVPGQEITYRGRPVTTSLRLGFGRTGDIEVELVQVVAGEWPTVEWLATHGEGLHHIRYPVADFDATKSEMEADGFEVILTGSTPGLSFAYLESPLLNGMAIELITSPMRSPLR